jgi:hypothetical protein
MATIHDDVWADKVRPFLPKGPKDALPKGKQQALAGALQEWAALHVVRELEAVVHETERPELMPLLSSDAWKVHFKGKRFLGALRWQEVDVWLTNPETGLALAVDPKQFQSEKSFDKNWKNGLNDLLAFSTNLHERFPGCAVGGFISFPEWATRPQSLQQIHGICARAIPRERPLNAYGKFEGLGLAVYDASGQLVWPLKADSPLKPCRAFRGLAAALYTRTLSLL